MKSKYILFSIVLLTVFGCTNHPKEPSFYQNPILAGFYPDPSIVQANGKYYLVTSSFAYFPGLPIFESEDLINWKQIGHVLDRSEQLDTEGAGVSRGLFAPAINFHNGVFYLVCTLIDKGGNFVVTATNPAGPWSNPVWLPEVNGIDPSLFFDDDKAYILYNSIPPDNISLYSGHRTIRIYPFDKDSLKVVGEESILINGGVDITKNPVWIEAPHLYKIDGEYFLMCAEGGTAYNHSEVIFKGESPMGPFVPRDKNPILTQRHLDPNRANPITTTGHADLVQTKTGDWYAVFLGCRPYGDNFYNTGRETFMTPVKWVEGWPVINPDFDEVQYSYPTPLGNTIDKTQFQYSGNLSFKDEFDLSELGMNYLFLRTPKEKWYDLDKGSLAMKLRKETASGVSNPSFIAHRQQHLTGKAEVRLSFDAKTEDEQAGLLFFQNESHFYFLAKTTINDTPSIALYKSAADSIVLMESIPYAQSSVILTVEFDKGSYSFSISDEGNKILLSDQIDGTFLSTKVAGGFVGTVIAMYATGNGTDTQNIALFDYFLYEGNDVTFK